MRLTVVNYLTNRGNTKEEAMKGGAEDLTIQRLFMTTPYPKIERYCHKNSSEGFTPTNTTHVILVVVVVVVEVNGC